MIEIFKGIKDSESRALIFVIMCFCTLVYLKTTDIAANKL